MDKLTPIFRAPRPQLAVATPAPSARRRLPACPSRRQRRFERRLAARRLAQQGAK